MPVVRSDDEQVEVVADDITAMEGQGACGDMATPINRPGRSLTRLQKRKEGANGGSVDDGRVRRIVEDSLRGFREEIGDLIAEKLRNLTFANPRLDRQEEPIRATERVEVDQPEHEEQYNRGGTSRYGCNDRQTRGSRYVHDDLDRNSERVLNLIRNWTIRFTGDTTEVTVDEFIYRVNTLTNANLRGDYDLLCEHAHILFEGKALKWFWRIHRSFDNLDWDELCGALKRQFKEYNTDFDIKDDIRRRKLKQNESFDDYYDAIMVLCDRLRIPLSDHELCETTQQKFGMNCCIWKSLRYPN